MIAAQRVSQDYEGLKADMQTALAQRQHARIAPERLRWISHLLEIKELMLAVDIGQHLTYEELRGLVLLEEVMQNSEATGGRVCPRCKSSTTSLYNCGNCGMRLR